MRTRAIAPPAQAVKVLERCLPRCFPIKDERDVIVGDLLQSFADRVDAGRRGNRAWFWGQAALFAASSLIPQSALPIPGGPKMSFLDSLGRSVRHAGRRLRHDWRFAVGALLILANWPYTLLAIKPTNDRLHATKPELANAEARHAIISWGHLHGGRGAFGIAATLMFLWALVA